MIYMTEERWNNTHKDYVGQVGGRRTCVAPRGTDFVEIVSVTDSRIDDTGYGYYPGVGAV